MDTKTIIRIAKCVGGLLASIAAEKVIDKVGEKFTKGKH